jgi:UrcA family protein
MCACGRSLAAVRLKPKETMMFRAITTASILALTVTTGYAASDTVEVKFGDLNLSKPSDARILDDRIQQAANGVCDELLWSYPAAGVYQYWYKRCINATVAQLAKQVEARVGAYRTFARN